MLAASFCLYICDGPLAPGSGIRSEGQPREPLLLKDLSRSLAGRLISLGIFALGFWVLYQGLLRDDNLILLVLGVVAGSGLILGGLYLMATTRRLAARRASEQDAQRETELEDMTGDSLDGSRKSD